jgi:hypothetical protein
VEAAVVGRLFGSDEVVVGETRAGEVDWEVLTSSVRCCSVSLLSAGGVCERTRRRFDSCCGCATVVVAVAAGLTDVSVAVVSTAGACVVLAGFASRVLVATRGRARKRASAEDAVDAAERARVARAGMCARRRRSKSDAFGANVRCAEVVPTGAIGRVA